MRKIPRLTSTVAAGLIGFFMVTQALILASRFSSLFDSARNLSEALHRKNRLLKQEVEARIRAQQDTVAVGEAERSRISHALHDGLCQQLTGARLTCSILARKWPAGQRIPAELDRLASILDESVSHAHDLSRGLWPVESGDPDLCRALADFVAERQRSSKLPIVLLLEGTCRTCVCNNAAHLHSIAREAVVNALKHAAPKKITLRLACRERECATLTVDDDGIGWAARPRTDDRSDIGLRIMAYRARMVGGEFSVGSGPDGGTRITASIPCRAA